MTLFGYISATWLHWGFQLLQPLGSIRVLGAQLQRLFVVLDRKVLVAVLPVRVAKAVVGVEVLGKHLNVELENVDVTPGRFSSAAARRFVGVECDSYHFNMLNKFSFIGSFGSLA